MSDPAVRACDAIFAVADAEVPAVEFAAPVRGQAIPKAPRVAVSFVARADASLVSQQIAAFRFTTEGNAAPTLESARCFDAAGAAVSGTPLSIAD